MPGQAVVTIKGKQWSVSVANTLAELTTGLSGVENLPPQTGMLFDLGYDQKYIAINMSQMLFPLDIIFINSTRGVVGVLQNVPPGQDAYFNNQALPGARCFLEVNAGEAEGIAVGDPVTIQGYAQTTTQFNIGSLTNIMVAVMLTTWMVKMVDKTLAPKPVRLLGGGKLPPGYKPVRLPQTTKGQKEYVKIIAPGKTCLTIGSVVAREELERENKKARERGEQPATAEVWEGGKPVMIRPELIPIEKSKAQSDKLEYLADSPEFLTQTIEDIGYRDKLDSAFQQAIVRVKGLK